MKLPEGNAPQKADQQIITHKGSDLGEKPAEGSKGEAKEGPPGIFKTMNELFLGDEEEHY